MRINDVLNEGLPGGEYSRVLTALKMYYPDKFSMQELNTPEWHRVIANKADVPMEYAGDVIDGFVKASQRNDDDEDDGNDEGHDYWEPGKGWGHEKDMPEGLNEFSPAGGGGGNTPRGPRTPGRDPWGGDDSGEDPYSRPEPEYYSRSIDYFGRFEADHFDDEEFDKDTGVFKGYWDDAEGRVQIGYFKFDDPARTGSDDPGMGWYYEPQNESVAEGIDDEDYGPELAALQKEFGKFTTHYDRMDQDPAYAAQWRKQHTDRLNQQGPDDEDMMSDIGDEMGQDDEDSMREGKPREKEADYGADYQDMVARVKKLAGLGPLKTVYDPQKRVYKNVPKAEQPKKEQR